MLTTPDLLLFMAMCCVGSFVGGLTAILYLANWAGYGQDEE